MTDEKTVKKIADAARLHLTDQELKKMAADLKSIVESFKVLSQADVEKVKPSFQPLDIKNATREDKVEPSLPREKALANTKNKENGYFTGPSVI